jgi:pimeloyl-ACP methyl ester carboxylesterase
MSSSHPALTARVTSHVVSSFDGTRIHFDLYDRPSRAAILIVPGFWRDRKHPSMVRLATLIADLGYRVAIVDLRGHGESEGTYGFNLHEHYDVAAVADEILRLVPVETLTLFGLSYGGAIAISTAARHRLPVASILLVSSVADFSMIVPRINLFTIHRHIAFRQALKRPRFLWRIRGTTQLSALEDMKQIRVPVSMIHVKDDWLVAHSHSEALHASANDPKELHILDIEGNYHADRIFSVAADAIEPLVRDFLLRYTPR